MSSSSPRTRAVPRLASLLAILGFASLACARPHPTRAGDAIAGARPPVNSVAADAGAALDLLAADAGACAPDAGSGGAAPPPDELTTRLQTALGAAASTGEGAADLSALEPLAREAEAAAPSKGPPSLWLLAARARRLRTDALVFRAAQATIDAAPGESARELLALLSSEARACAADAHHAWVLLLPAGAAAIESGQPAAQALAAAPADAAEPLYLDALCAAAWARAQGFTYLVEQHALLQAQLSRAQALAPSLDDAGPDRELGRLLASLPAYAGGDLAAARARFESSIALAPQALWNRVLFARTVAVKSQDRALFTSLLNTVLSMPAARPADQSARAEASTLLEHGDDLFGAVPH